MKFLNEFVLLVVCLKLSIDEATGGSISSLQEKPLIPPEIFPGDTNIPHNTQQSILLPPVVFPSGPQKSLKRNLNEAPEIFPTGASILEISSQKNAIFIPPLYFPPDTNASNKTALKILQEHTDLKNLDTSSPGSIARTEVSNPKNDVENIQKQDKVTPKIELEERYHEKGNSDSHANLIEFDDNTVVDHPQLHHGHLMGIVTGLIAILCLGAFAGLVFWKKYLERKYGKRERLVNEDDYCDDRIRQFEQI